ncbi:MAG: methyltransferase [Candidatus Acidiferrales bacterium]
MRATNFEFRQRFWIIMAIFWGGFWLYQVDRTNIVQWFVDRVAPGNDSRQALLARVLFAVAALLVLLAASLRTWAAAYLRSTVVHDPSLHSETVVADGPYRYMRNPLYLGGILLALGVGLLASRSGFVVMVTGLSIFYLRLMGLEETNLVREQGESYREFCRRVPRLWPSLAPRVPRGNLEPKWRQAFGGELFMWGFFVGMMWFAVTLKIAGTWWIIGVTLVLWVAHSFFVYFRTKARERSSPQTS